MVTVAEAEQLIAERTGVLSEAEESISAQRPPPPTQQQLRQTGGGIKGKERRQKVATIFQKAKDIALGQVATEKEKLTTFGGEVERAKKYDYDTIHAQAVAEHATWLAKYRKVQREGNDDAYENELDSRQSHWKQVVERGMAKNYTIQQLRGWVNDWVDHDTARSEQKAKIRKDIKEQEQQMRIQETEHPRGSYVVDGQWKAVTPEQLETQLKSGELAAGGMYKDLEGQRSTLTLMSPEHPEIQIEQSQQAMPNFAERYESYQSEPTSALDFFTRKAQIVPVSSPVPFLAGEAARYIAKDVPFYQKEGVVKFTVEEGLKPMWTEFKDVTAPGFQYVAKQNILVPGIGLSPPKISTIGAEATKVLDAVHYVGYEIPFYQGEGVIKFAKEGWEDIGRTASGIDKPTRDQEKWLTDSSWRESEQARKEAIYTVASAPGKLIEPLAAITFFQVAPGLATAGIAAKGLSSADKLTKVEGEASKIINKQIDKSWKEYSKEYEAVHGNKPTKQSFLEENKASIDTYSQEVRQSLVNKYKTEIGISAATLGVLGTIKAVQWAKTPVTKYRQWDPLNKKYTYDPKKIGYKRYDTFELRKGGKASYRMIDYKPRVDVQRTTKVRELFRMKAPKVKGGYGVDKNWLMSQKAQLRVTRPVGGRPIKIGTKEYMAESFKIRKVPNYRLQPSKVYKLADFGKAGIKKPIYVQGQRLSKPVWNKLTKVEKYIFKPLSPYGKPSRSLVRTISFKGARPYQETYLAEKGFKIGENLRTFQSSAKDITWRGVKQIRAAGNLQRSVTHVITLKDTESLKNFKYIKAFGGKKTLFSTIFPQVAVQLAPIIKPVIKPTVPLQVVKVAPLQVVKAVSNIPYMVGGTGLAATSIPYSSMGEYERQEYIGQIPSTTYKSVSIPKSDLTFKLDSITQPAPAYATQSEITTFQVQTLSPIFSSMAIAQTPKSRSAQVSIPASALASQITLQRTTARPQILKPSISTGFFPPKKIPGGLRKRSRTIRKRPVTFTPYVKRYGKWKPVSKPKKKKKEAIKIGVRTLRGTLAASLQIRGPKGKPIPFARPTKKEFRLGKGSALTLVEKAPRRLKARTEVREIIRTRRMKNVKFFK